MQYFGSTLYDSKKLDIKNGYFLKFMRSSSDEVLHHEKLMEFSFDYNTLNESYKTRVTPFTKAKEIEPIYALEKMGTDALSEQVIFPKIYVPPMILERQLLDLQDEIESKQVIFDNEKASKN